jgi:hypothetical protein
MLWGQNIKVFTDHANVMRDALDFTLAECTNGGYSWKSMGLRLSILKAYTKPLQMQSRGLSMTPVSIKQLRVSKQRKSGTQKAVRDKAG